MPLHLLYIFVQKNYDLKEMKALASKLSLKVKLDVEQHEDACSSMC